MLVFQHSLVQASIALHNLNLLFFFFFFWQHFPWRCVIRVCTKHVVKASRPIITQCFLHWVERKSKKLIIPRNYINLRQSITVSIVQYFNIFFYWKEKSLFMLFELHKGVYYRFLNKNFFFLRTIYTETFWLKH